MRIEFIKNVQFTRLLKVDGRFREFNFRKMNTPNEELFTVDVSDDRGNRIMFRMGKSENTWKIMAHPLPGWILDHEKNFNDLIEQELLENMG